MDNLYETLVGLERLVKDPCIDWNVEDPWVVEALRGSVLETGWRRGGWKRSDWKKSPNTQRISMGLAIESGRLSNYFDDASKIVKMAERAIERLKLLNELGYIEYPDVNTIPDVIGLGTLWWDYNPEVIRVALDNNIRFFDTSETYGYGRTETALGNILEKEQGIIIATRMSRTHVSYQSTLNAAARSLGRLHGNVNLYQAHRYNSKYPVSDVVNAIKSLLIDNKVDRVGVSCYSADQIEIAQHELFPYKVMSVQARYNLMERGVECALLPFCQERGIVLIAYSPLSQNFRKFMDYDKCRILIDIAKRYDATPAQIVLAWLLSHDWVLPIPKTNKVRHVQEIADATDIQLDTEDIEEIENAFPIIN